MTDLAVGATKTLAAGEDAFVSVGEQVTFRISGTNSSDTTATAMSLTDVLDAARFAYVGATPSATATSSGTATFTFGATAPGATREATITLVALSEGVTRNDLAVSATDAGGDTAVATDDEPVTVTDLAVGATKTLAAGEDAFVSVGEQVTFRISGTNSSNTTATAMSLTDVFDAARFAYVGATPSATRHLVGHGDLHLRRDRSRRHA